MIAIGIIVFIVSYSVVADVDYCSWDSSSDRCTVNNKELLTLLDTSTNPFAKFMRCELLTNKQSCDKYSETCQWNKGSGFQESTCSVQLSKLASNLTACVDETCKQDLLKISDDNVTIPHAKNCDFSSFLFPQPNNEFCKIAQGNSNCYQNGRGNCESQYCRYFDRCNLNPEKYPSISQVDLGIGNLMNLQYSVSLVFTLDFRPYHRIRVLDTYVLDEFLGFEQGTMEKFHYCSFLEDCSADGYEKYLEQVQNQNSSNNGLGFGWGLIVLISGMSFLCCFGICGTIQKIRIQQLNNNNNSNHNSQSSEETELVEFQSRENVKKIMQQLKHSKFELKIRHDIENQINCDENSTKNSGSDENSSKNLDSDENLSKNSSCDKNSSKNLDSDENSSKNSGFECCEDEDDQICAICYDGYVQGQDVTHLKCNHMYHMSCIERWVKTKGVNSTCPLCGAKLVDSST